MPARPKTSSAAFGTILSVVIWGGLTVWVLFHLMGMFSDCHRSDVSAIQQAASAAMSCTYIVAGYAVARAADCILYRAVTTT